MANPPRAKARRKLLVLFASCTVPLAALAGCVEGTTPNCADAASGCSPDLDGSFEGGEGGESGSDVQAPDSSDSGSPGADAADAADAKDAGDAGDADGNG